MSLTTPKIVFTGATVFDASNSIQILFQVIGGDQVVASVLEVYDLSNNLIYTNTTPDETFTLTNTISANSLQDGNNYKVHIKTKNSKGEFSQFSDWFVIKCYSVATIDITNIEDGGIYNNQNLIVNGSYLQPDDPLMTYQYFLYDNSMNLLGQSDLLYDGLLTCQLGTLENNESYYIKLQTTSQSGTMAQITKYFTVEYIQPQFSNLMTLTNNKDNASVDIEVIGIRTIGHIKSGTVTSDGEYIDCINGNGIVQFDDQNNDGLYFKYNQGNWQMQLWLKGLIDQYMPINGILEGTLIAQLFGDNGVMCKLEYYNGMFHYYKFITVNNQYQLISHYVSNVINATSSDKVYLFINCQNDRIGISAQINNN